jgi:cytochrome c-type biogenesis protein CcmH/NrfG
MEKDVSRLRDGHSYRRSPRDSASGVCAEPAGRQPGDCDLDAALKETPKDKRIWALRGMAYAGKGASSSALDSYQHAIKLDPAYLPALEGAAQIAYQQRSAAAKPLILRVLAQLPDDPTSHTMLAYLEYAAKDCAGAIPHFEKGGEVLRPMALAWRRAAGTTRRFHYFSRL